MLRDLTLIVPLGFAAALSPMMLTEQTVLLAGHDGRRVASRYALGVALVTAVYLGALVAFGRAISLPKRPTLSASMDILVGAILVLLAVAIHRRPAKPEQPKRTGMGSTAAFGFGVFSMATNFTSLALLLPAAKDIAADASNVIVRVALIAVLVVLTTMPAWIPIAMTRVAPGPAERALTWLNDLIAQNGRKIAAILIAALGTVLIVRGALHIV
jgi:hypothetical protein